MVEDALRAAVCRAGVLRDLGRSYEAVESLRLAAAQYAAVPSVHGRNYLASTLAVYARSLGEQGRSREAMRAYRDALETVDPAPDLEFREMTASWLIELGGLQLAAGDRAGAARSYRTVFDRYSTDPEGRLPHLASWAGCEAAGSCTRSCSPALRSSSRGS